MRHTVRLYPDQAADTYSIRSLRRQYSAKSADTNVFNDPMHRLLFAEIQPGIGAINQLGKTAYHIQIDLDTAARATAQRRVNEITKQMLCGIAHRLRFINAAQIEIIRHNILFQHLEQRFQFRLHRRHADETRRCLRRPTHFDAHRYCGSLQIKTEQTVSVARRTQLDAGAILARYTFGEMHIQRAQRADPAAVPPEQMPKFMLHRSVTGHAGIKCKRLVQILLLFGMFPELGHITPDRTIDRAVMRTNIFQLPNQGIQRACRQQSLLRLDSRNPSFTVATAVEQREISLRGVAEKIAQRQP